jgi:hypothetical protein
MKDLQLIISLVCLHLKLAGYLNAPSCTLVIRNSDEYGCKREV